jgi:hypothetical protein
MGLMTNNQNLAEIKPLPLPQQARGIHLQCKPFRGVAARSAATARFSVFQFIGILNM